MLNVSVITALLISAVIAISKFSMEALRRSDQKKGLYLSDKEYSLLFIARNIFSSQEQRKENSSILSYNEYMKKHPDAKKRVRKEGCITAFIAGICTIILFILHSSMWQVALTAVILLVTSTICMNRILAWISAFYMAFSLIWAVSIVELILLIILMVTEIIFAVRAVREYKNYKKEA